MKYKYNIRYILILIFLFISFFLIEFRIKSISLYGGSSRYNKVLYSTLQRNYINSNIFFINSHNIFENIVQIDPLVGNIRLKKVYPNKIDIYIKKQNIIFTYEYNKKYLFITNNGVMLKGFNSNLYPIIKSQIPINNFYISKLLKLVNDISKQITLHISYYTLSNNNMSLHLDTNQVALMTFNRSISSQISSIIYIVNNLPSSKCKTINVEFNHVYCSI
jgi:cell division septal protein FtsQ